MYLYTPGTPNWNAASTSGQHMTIGLDYYTIVTTVNILQAAATQVTDASALANASTFVAGTIPNDASQDALDRLIEIVSQNGQPVIMGTPSVSSGTYTFSFAIEHKTAWGVVATATPTAVPALVAAIQNAGKDFGFYTDGSLAATVKNSL